MKKSIKLNIKEGDDRGGSVDEKAGGENEVSSKSEDGRRMLTACLKGIDVTELYSPERINRVCREYVLGAEEIFWW